MIKLLFNVFKVLLNVKRKVEHSTDKFVYNVFAAEKLVRLLGLLKLVKYASLFVKFAVKSSDLHVHVEHNFVAESLNTQGARMRITCLKGLAPVKVCSLDKLACWTYFSLTSLILVEKAVFFYGFSLAPIFCSCLLLLP